MTNWYISNNRYYRKNQTKTNYSQNYQLIKTMNRLDQRINVLLNELRKVLGESVDWFRCPLIILVSLSLNSIYITEWSISFNSWRSALFFSTVYLDVGTGLTAVSESSPFVSFLSFKRNEFWCEVSAVIGNGKPLISFGCSGRPLSSSLFFYRVYLSSKLY